MFANFGLWSITGFFAVLAMLDVPMLYQMLGYVALAAGWITGIRIFVQLIIWTLSFFLDSLTEYKDLNYFNAQLGWGSAMTGIGDFYNLLDI